VTIADIQARAETFNSSGQPWEQVSAVLLRYRSQYEWMIEPLEALEADFRDAYAENDALAADLTRRGATVYGVLFKRRHYQDWLADRRDSREMREKWARQWVTENTGSGIFVFTLGALKANEPAAPTAEALFGGSETPIGWAIYQSAE
jgi:hypothetical protein